MSNESKAKCGCGLTRKNRRGCAICNPSAHTVVEFTAQSTPSVDTTCIGLHQMAVQISAEKMRAEFDRWSATQHEPISPRMAWQAGITHGAAQSAATIARLTEKANEAEKWKGIALAKDGDGRTVQQIETPLLERAAAAEADNARLREALKLHDSWHREYDDHDGYAKSELHVATETALSTSLSTSALDTYVAEKTAALSKIISQWERTYDRIVGEKRELQAKVDALKWRPIETAPKDGTHIIVADFRANAPGYGYFKGEWQFAETVAHWFADGFYPSWCEIACERPIDVSHWMPLPPAPDKQKG